MKQVNRSRTALPQTPFHSVFSGCCHYLLHIPSTLIQTLGPPVLDKQGLRLATFFLEK
jgi:hypothetical protein